MRYKDLYFARCHYKDFAVNHTYNFVAPNSRPMWERGGRGEGDLFYTSSLL